MVGVIGWAVIIGVIVVWESIALISTRDAWPTFSDIMRMVTSRPAGRWIVFALWLWLGWHLFVRGWQFFLRTLPSADRGGAEAARDPRPALAVPGSLTDAVNEGVVPLVLAYAVTLVLLVLCARDIRRGRVPARRSRPAAAPPVGRALARHVVTTALAGYALFVAAVALYHNLFARGPRDLLTDAVLGGGFLAFVAAVPAFLLLSALHGRVMRRDDGPADVGGRPRSGDDGVR